MKKIAILGSTGSIGTQTLEVVRENQDIEVCALAAGSNIARLEQQIREMCIRDRYGYLPYPGFHLQLFPDQGRDLPGFVAAGI